MDVFRFYKVFPNGNRELLAECYNEDVSACTFDGFVRAHVSGLELFINEGGDDDA